MELNIVFNHPDRVLSPNASVPLTARGAKAHNIKRMAEKTKTRELARIKALVEVSKLPQRNFPAKWLEVTWFYKGMKPDIDNVVARLKPLIDGCAIAFGINDRDLELGRVRRVHTLDEQAGTLVLHFDTEEHKLFRLAEWQNARVCYSKNAENAQQKDLSFTGEQQTHQDLFTANGN